MTKRTCSQCEYLLPPGFDHIDAEGKLIFGCVLGEPLLTECPVDFDILRSERLPGDPACQHFSLAT